MADFNNSKKEMEDFGEVPQAPPPFARNVSISNAEGKYVCDKKEMV